MAAGQVAGVSEAQIAVHWREEEYYYPHAKFIAQANAGDPAIFNRFSEEHFPECFKEAGLDLTPHHSDQQQDAHLRGVVWNLPGDAAGAGTRPSRRPFDS